MSFNRKHNQPFLPDMTNLFTKIFQFSKPLLLFSIYINFSSVASGQRNEPQSLPQKIVLLDSLDWEIHDIRRSNDGEYLLAAGYVADKNGSKNGLFLKIDLATRSLAVPPFIFGKSNDEEFFSVAEADDGSFYLVGYRVPRQDGARCAWLVRVDRSGKQKIFEWAGVQSEFSDLLEFSKIVWPTSSSQGFIVGKKAQNDGSIWWASVTGNDLQQRGDLGGGNLKKFIGLENADASHAWLCANTRKIRGKADEDDLWVAVADKNGTVEELPFFRTKIRRLPAVGTAVGGNGQLLIFGESKEMSGKPDALVREIPFGLDGEEKPYRFGEEFEETAVCGFKTDEDELWTVYRAGQKDFFVRQRDSRDENDFHLNGGENFQPVRMLRIAHGQYLVAGNCDRSANSEKRAIRLIFFSENGAGGRISSRDVPNVQCEEIRVESPGSLAGNCMMTDREAKIWVKLQNLNQEALLDARLTVEVQGSAPSQFDVRKSYVIDRLTQSSPIDVPIWAQPGAAQPGSEVTLKISLRDTRGGEVCTTLFSLKFCKIEKTAEPIAAAPTVDLTITKPGPSERSKGSPTQQNTVAVEFNLKTKEQVSASDISVKTKNAGASKRPREEEIVESGSGNLNDKRFQTAFVATVKDLESGENWVYFMLKDEIIDSMKITYTPVPPNVYLLAIAPEGPNYGNLDFNDDDARDFATQLVKCQGRFFGKIQTKVLTTLEETTRTNIENEFAEIKTLYDKQVIQDKDYVIIFMAGHGVSVSDEFYFLTSEKFNRDRPKASALNYNYIAKEYLRTVNCKKLIISDACHSQQQQLDDENSRGDGIDSLAIEGQREANKYRGTASFYSCLKDQSSYEDQIFQNGIFTEALLEALRGQPVRLENAPAGTSEKDRTLQIDSGHPDPNCPTAKEKPDACPFVGVGDRQISAFELQRFLEKRVPDLLQKANPKLAGLQMPFFQLTGFDQHVTVFSLP